MNSPLPDDVKYKKTLKYLCITLISTITIISLTIIASNEHDRHSIIYIALNTTAGIATIFGAIAIYRHKIIGIHGISYLFLTLGIALWFCADLNLLYSYFFNGVTEQKQISISDVLWFSGYVFLILHLMFIARTINIEKKSKALAILLIITISIAILNTLQSSIHNLFTNNKERDKIEKELGLVNILITTLYPILDLSLIIPSLIILVELYHDYQHAIPWVLSSLSLLINAIADNGYVNDFIKGSTTLWKWDLFYINDFILMAAALYWFNRFHISNSINKNRNKKIKNV